MWLNSSLDSKLLNKLMISFLIYCIKIFLSFFVTALLVTDLTNNNEKDNHLYIYLFTCLFSLTLITILGYLNISDLGYGLGMLISFLIIYSLTAKLNPINKIKTYVIALMASMLGMGYIFHSFLFAFISYILIHNRLDISRYFNLENDFDVDDEQKIYLMRHRL